MSTKKKHPVAPELHGLQTPSTAAQARAQAIFKRLVKKKVSQAIPTPKPTATAQKTPHPRHYPLAQQVFEACTPKLAQPPVGVAVVRDGMKSYAATDTSSMLENMTDAVVVRKAADGRLTFDIVFSDSIFANLLCCISCLHHHTTALFQVESYHQQRLLQASVGRLQQALEARGFCVDAIDVQVRR